MSRICEDPLTGLRFDLSRVMRIDPIIKSGEDKPYYTVHYDDGSKQQVFLVNPDSPTCLLRQSYRHLFQNWEHYQQWG